MIFYLAALQNIDRSIYEAARVDGVGWAALLGAARRGDVAEGHGQV